MKKIFFIAICLIITITISAQKNKKVEKNYTFDGLDTLFEKVLKDWKAVGFAVAIVEKDKIVYSKGFGYSNLETKTPVTPNTLFAIGSCTKAFTASLLGILEKENNLDLDKPVRNFLPELEFYNDELNNHVTLRDMMSHRTGLPRHDYSWYLFQSQSRDSLLKRIKYQEPTAELRQKWQYNNFMYLAQGMLIEKLTHKSWEENVKEKIFIPLGMNRTNTSIKDLEKSSDASLGYSVKNDSIIKKLDYYPINAMGPAGSINSSVNEMSNWVMTWINNGKLKGKEIIPSLFVTQAKSSQMVIGAALPENEFPDIHFSNYGLGWMTSSYKGHYRVEHGGNIDGFSASTSFFPSDSIGIIVLVNQNGSQVPSIIRNTLADRVLNLSKTDWNTDRKKIVDKANKTQKEAEKNVVSNKKAGTKTSHYLKEYEGIYSNSGYGSFDIYFKNDSLFAATTGGLLWITPYHYDVFELFDVDAKEGIDTSQKTPTKLNFKTNDAGEIESLYVLLEPTLKAFEFTKKPKEQTINADDLKKYVGEYELAPGAIAKIYIKNENTLFVFLQGQPEYELVSLGNNKFSIKILNGYNVHFVLNEKNEIKELLFVQPNGTFKAIKK